MTREEAKLVLRSWGVPKGREYEAIMTLNPELKESEDERIRKFLVKHISEWIGCIEHDLKISTKDVESEEELAMFKAGLAYLEKQKEQEHVCDSAQYEEGFKTGLEMGLRKQNEQKPNIELIQKSWYMEGYHDRKFGYEPRWIIKTGEGGPRYEENPKYGQHIEKQDYSGLNDFEQAIHRGFLCAGVVNVPVNIIKETAQDCLAHLPAEWSEEDRRIADRIQMILEFYDRNYPGDGDIESEVPKYISWLKSLRPFKKL